MNNLPGLFSSSNFFYNQLYYRAKMRRKTEEMKKVI